MLHGQPSCSEWWHPWHEIPFVTKDSINPRRDDWDDSWELAPGTKSPVSLLELGLCARSGKLKVCCPEGFWRRGNVEVMCQRYQVPLFGTLDGLIADLKRQTA